MRSPAAQILETALALHRAPGERFRVRERPLQAGIVYAFEIAAGSPQAVQAAAAELGEPEPLVVEATRFYLEQVLFADPLADAYRVLGLSPDASQEAIRTHHRWLQRWLHPDRAQAGDASIFATRVNQAFAQLRLPETRHAYDVRLAEARLAGAAAPLSPETLRHWGHDEDAPRYGRRSRWLLAAALVACVVLVVLIVRNPENGAQWNPEDIADDLPSGAPARPVLDDRDFGVLDAALAGTPTLEAMPTAASAAPSPARQAQAAPARPSAIPPRTIAAIPALATHVAPPDPRGQRGTSSAASAPPVPVAGFLPETQAPATPPTLPKPAQIASVPRASSEVAAAIPAAATPAPQRAEVSPIGSEEANLVAARFPLAEQRIAQVAGYLASRPEAVPLWDSVKAMTESDQLRQRLNARKGSTLELSGRAWRMRPEQASLTAYYRCRSYNDAPCNGRLEVTLVWREGLWLVRGVSLGPAA